MILTGGFYWWELVTRFCFCFLSARRWSEMKKSTSFLIIAIIIFSVNMSIGIPLIMFVALGVAIVSVCYSIKEKKDRIEKN